MIRQRLEMHVGGQSLTLGQRRRQVDKGIGTAYLYTPRKSIQKECVDFVLT